MHVLFLHGFTGSPQSGASLRAHLGDAVRSWLAPAGLGHGAPQPWATSFDDEVRRLAAHLQRPTVVVGYSLGARLALKMALDFPTQIERLMLIGVNPGLEHAEDRTARVHQDERLAARIEQDGVESFVDEWQRLALFGEDELPAHKRSARRQIRLAHSRQGLAASLRVLGLGAMPSAWSRLPELRLRAQVVAGEKDEKFVALARRFQSITPRTQLRLMADSAHDALLHDPKQIAAWLTEPARLEHRAIQ